MLDVFGILCIGIFWRMETLIGITSTLFFNGGSFQERKHPNQNHSRETIMPSHVSPRRSCIGLTAILPSCFQIHSLPPWTAATKIGTQGRKSGKNGAGEENRASGNFSRAKYHADWLEVMKFWWLIKCKKIYRLRPSALPFLLFFSGWSQSPTSRASFLLHFSFVSRSFRGAAGFAKWTEERLKGAKGDVGVKFKTPGNRLGTLEESTTNCTPASLFLSFRLGPLSNPRESHFPRLNVSFRGKIPLSKVLLFYRRKRRFRGFQLSGREPNERLVTGNEFLYVNGGIRYSVSFERWSRIDSWSTKIFLSLLKLLSFDRN